MKKNTHPERYEVNVVCVCGATFQTLSTVKLTTVDVCSACHPFFTGKEKLMDTAGRIDRFNKKYSKEVRAPGPRPVIR